VKGILGVVTITVLLSSAACGGTAELDPQEAQTVTLAKSAVAAAQGGPLSPGEEKNVETLIVLCRQKPLAEADGRSMREVLLDLAPRLSGVDPELSSKLRRIARNGCE
jgi:hypothetical protein